MNKNINNEKSLKNLLSIIMRQAPGFAILIGALALTSSAQVKTTTTTSPTTSPTTTSATTPPSAPVTVVNTTANPVPVAGTVNVGGTANVRISDNSATNPLQVRDVDNARRTAFAQTKRLTFNGPDRAILGNFDVPDGKRLVIESFSVFGKLPSGNELVASSINAFQGGEQFGTQHFAPVFTGKTEETFEPGVFIVSSGSMHLEAVAGNGTITVRLERDHIIGLPNFPPFSFDVSITGYLVDAQQ